VTDINTEPGTDRTPIPTVAFTLRPIGVVHATPRNKARTSKYFVPKGRAILELFQPYLSGLQGLYGGIELWVITYHAPSRASSADSHPGGGDIPGVFSTTSVGRPNPIEFLRARITEFDSERGLLHVEGLDSEDGAPILDIRPATAPHHRLTKPGEG